MWSDRVINVVIVATWFVVFASVHQVLTVVTATATNRLCPERESWACCRPNNDSNAPLCSLRGICVNGQCICFKLLDERQLFYGKYCECDNFSCPRADGKVCGGHGTCGCGRRCNCEAGWTGRDCSCPTSTVTCLASNGKICNDKGVCLCGTCVCFDEMYSNATCESCPTCPTPCVRYRDCVLYEAFNRRSMNQSEFEIRCQHNFIIVKELPDVYKNMSLPEACQFVDAEDECTYYFKFAVSEGENDTLLIREEKGQNCLGF